MNKKSGYKKLLYGVIALSLTTYSAYSETVEVANKKAENYHKLLLKRPDNATVFDRFVNAWLDSGDKEGLKQWLTEKASSGELADLRVLASYCEYLGEDEQAVKLLAQAIEKAPVDVSLRFARAKMLARSLDFDNALKDLEFVIKDEKLAIDAAKLKGTYLARAGQIEKAVAAWKEVITRFPKDEELREDLIEMLVVEGLYEDATKSSQELIAMTKDPYLKVVRQMRLASIEILAGKREEGVATYMKVLDSTGEGTWIEREVLARLENVYLREDNVKGLRELYQKIRETYPRRVTIQKALAYQMAANGELDEAVSLFKDVLKITPGNLKNRTDFIKFLEKNQKWEEVKTELTEILKTKENDATLWQNLANIEQHLNNSEGVKQALSKFWDLKKSAPDGVITAVNLYDKAKLKKEAEEKLRAGAKLFEDSDEIKEALASFLIQNRKEEEAVSIWQKMAEDSPRDILLRVTRSLSGHDKASEAFNLLLKRIGEFENDVLVLSKFCELAHEKEQAEKALPRVMHLISIAGTPTDLEASMRLAMRVIETAEKTEELTTQLSPKHELSVAECCLLAEIFAKTGDTIGADKFLQKAEEVEDGLLAKLYRVHYHEKRGNVAEAIKLMESILASPEGKKTVYIRRLIGLLQRDGKLELALERIEEWKRMAPGDKAAWQRRADILAQLGKVDESLLEIRRMIGKFGPEEGLRSALANRLLDAGEFHEAKKIYQQLYDESETLQSKLRWVGEQAKLAQMEGSVNVLIESFDKRSKSNPQSIEPLLAKAEIHKIFRNTNGRIEAMTEAVEKRPNDPQLLIRLSEVELESGRYDQAVESLRKAVSFDNTSNAQETLAKLLLSQGDIEDGLRILSQIPGETLDPRKVEKTMLSLIKSDEPEIALKYWKNVPQHHADWRLLYLKGICLQKIGKTREAFKLFMSMKSVEGVIQGVKPLRDPNLKQQAYYHSGYYSRYNLLQIAGWSDLTTYWNYIYNEEQIQAQAAQYGRQHYANNLKINMPGTVKELGILSVLRAAMLAKQFSPEEKIKAWESLSIEGVEKLPLFLKQTIENPRRNDHSGERYKKLIAEELIKDPNDPILLANWLQSVDENNAPSKERALEIISILKNEHSELAVNVISTLYNLGVLDQAESVTKLIVTYDEANVEDKEQLIGKVLHSLSRFEESEEVEQEKIVKFRSDTLSYLLGQEKEPSQYYWVKNLLDQMLEHEEIDQAIKVINKLNQWELKRKPNAQFPQNRYRGSFYSYRGGRGQQGYLAAPTFPVNLKGIHSVNLQIVRLALPQSQKTNPQVPATPSKEVQDLLSQLGDRPKPFSKTGKESEKKSQKITNPLEKLKGKTDQIENPLFRSLVLLGLKDEAGFTKLVKEFEKSKTLADLQIAAYYHFDKGDTGKAYEALERASKLMGVSAHDRKIVDGQLIFVGGQIADEKGSSTDLESAKRAALRMRKSLLSQRQPELFKLMNQLGLTKEAEKMTQARKIQTSIANRSSRPVYQPRGVQACIVLVQEEKIDAAVIESVRQIRSNLKKSYNSQSELKKIVDFLKQHELLDKVIAQMKPADSASFNGYLSYADFLFYIDKAEPAKAIYSMLLERRPNSTAAYRGWISTADIEEVTEKFIIDFKADDFNSEKVNQACMSLTQKAENDVNLSLKLLKVISGFLDQLEPNTAEKVNLSWVNYTALNRLQDIYFSDYRLVPILESSAEGKLDEKNRLKSEERDGVAYKLLINMLKHPQTAEQGFVMLHAAREKLKLNDEQLAKFAKQAAANVMLRKNHQSAYNRQNDIWGSYTKFGSHGGGRAPRNSVDPIQFLARLDANEHVDFLSEEILEHIKEHQPERYKRLTLVLKLKNSKEEEALKAFAKWKEGFSEQDNVRNQEVNQFIETLLLIRPKAKSWHSELEGILLDESIILSGEWYTATTNWVKWLCLTEDSLACERFIKNIVIKNLAVEEKWPILAKLGNNNLPNDFKGVIYHLDQVFSSLLANSQTSAVASSFILKNDFTNLFQNSAYQIKNIWNSRHASAEDFIQWLKGTAFIQKHEKNSVLAPGKLFSLIEGIKQVRFNENKTKEKAAELLLSEKEFDPVLARIIAAYYLGPVKGREIITKAITEYPSDFEVLHGASQEKSLALIKYWFPDLKSDSKSKVANTYLSKFRRNLSQEAQEKAKQWMAEPIVLSDRDYNKWEEFTPYILMLIEIDPTHAADVWTKVLGDVKKQHEIYAATNQYYSARSTTWQHSWHDSLMRKLVDNILPTVDTVNLIKFLNSFYRGDASGYLTELSSQRGRYGRNAWGSFQKTFESLKIPKDKSYQTVGLALERLAQKLTKDEQVMMMILFFHNISENRNISSKQRKPFVEWVTKRYAQKDGPVADGMKSFGLMGPMSYLSQSGEEKAAGEKQMRSDFLNLLSYEGLSVPLRCDLIYFAIYNSSSRQLLESKEAWQALTKLMVEYSEGAWASSRTIWTNVIPYLSGMKFEGRNEVAAPLARAAEKLLLSQNQSNISISDNVLKEIAKLEIDGGGSEVVKQYMKSHSKVFRGDLSIMLSLAKQGNFDLAQRLIVPDSLNYDTSSLSRYYTSEFEELTQQLVSNVPEIGRYRLEVILSSLRDPSKEKPAVVYKDRLVALAKRFEKEKPALKNARMELLAIFVKEEEAAVIVNQELQKIASNTSLSKIVLASRISQTRISAGHLKTILSRELLSDAKIGNFDRIVKELKLLGLMKGSNEAYTAGSYAADLIENISTIICQALAEKPSEAHKMLPMADILIKCTIDLGKQTSKLQRLGILMPIVIYAVAEKMDNYDALIAAMKPEHKEEYNTYLTKDNLRYGFSSINKAWKADGNSEQRRKLAGVLFNNDWFCDHLLAHDNLIREMTYYRFVKLDEFNDVVATLPDEFTRKPELLCEKAKLLRKGSGEDKDLIFAEAYKIAEERNDKNLKSKVAADRSIMWKNHQKMNRAKEWAKQVKPDLLSKADLKRFSTHKELLKEAKPDEK